MKKLKVGYGKYLQGMLTMVFVANAFKYIPCDALRRQEIGEPDWFTFIFGMGLSILTYLLLDFFTKRESTKVNGTEVDLNGVDIDVTPIDDNKVNVSIGVPKGTKTEDTIKIINIVKAISDKNTISMLETEDKKND